MNIICIICICSFPSLFIRGISLMTQRQTNSYLTTSSFAWKRFVLRWNPWKKRGEEESVKWESELESLKAEQNHQRERFDRMEKKIDALLRHSKVKWEETSKLKEDTRFWSPSENRKQEQSELFDTRKTSNSKLNVKIQHSWRNFAV